MSENIPVVYVCQKIINNLFKKLSCTLTYKNNISIFIMSWVVM